MEIAVTQFVDRDGRSPFGRWFASLDSVAAFKVQTVMFRLADGNFSSVKGVGGGVFESRIHFGPGYRVYFGKDGDRLILLLGGGTKQRQSRDIADARARWQDYKRSKR